MLIELIIILFIAGSVLFAAYALSAWAVRRLRVKRAARQREEQRLSEQKNLESRLARFLPASLAADIAQGKKPLDLNGRRRPVSILFVEVRGLSEAAEARPPTQIIALLRQLFGMMSELVLRQGGALDRAAGSGLMAIFGAVDYQRDHAARALAAAEDIRRFVEATRPIRQKSYSFDVQIGIGVSSGDAVMGNLGCEGQLEYTAVGETVSAATNLAAIARPGQILVTGEVASSMAPAAGFELHSVGERVLIGSHRSTRLMELT